MQLLTNERGLQMVLKSRRQKHQTENHSHQLMLYNMFISNINILSQTMKHPNVMLLNHMRALGCISYPLVTLINGIKHCG